MSARDSWNQEKQAIFLYGVLVGTETSPERRVLFEKLAREAESQAKIWEGELREAGTPGPASAAASTPTYTPSARARLVALLVRRFGAARMRRVLAAMKVRGMSIYGTGSPSGAEGDPVDARLGLALTEAPSGHLMPKTVGDIDRRHRSVAGAHAGTLRAAVFGVNDGLVSNASLIFGVAGATTDHRIISLSGIAGLLAGAFSMAAGEYVSMQSQREMFERQIAVERDELARYPVEEAAELALIYEARGLPKADAERVAKTIIANPASALDTVAREELGLDPSELGSPWGAALSSFLAFSGGALIPLLPFVVGASAGALRASIVFAGVALFGVGATISLFTGRGALRGGLRMLLIGAAAGAATNFIGRLLGVK